MWDNRLQEQQQSNGRIIKIVVSSIVHSRDVSRIDRKITDRMIAIEPPIKGSVVRLMEGTAVTLMDQLLQKGQQSHCWQDHLMR